MMHVRAIFKSDKLLEHDVHHPSSSFRYVLYTGIIIEENSNLLKCAAHFAEEWIACSQSYEFCDAMILAAAIRSMFWMVV